MITSNAAVELLTRNLALRPEKVAYLCGGHALTFRELDRAARIFAGIFKKKEIAPGERVLIVLPDLFAFPAAFLGSLLCGALAVAVSADISEEELSFILADCGARLLLTNRELTARCAGIGEKVEVVLCGNDGLPEETGPAGYIDPFQPSAEDLAYMLYSSGSTGRPKGVPQPHGSLLLPCELVGKTLLGITVDDVIFSTSKLSFAYGLINSLAFPLFFGATAILHPGKPDPGSILEIMTRHKPTIFFSVPASYARIILSADARHLQLPMRLCLSAGDVLPAPLFEEWRRLTGMEILDGIGSTEMAYHFTCNRPGEAVPGSAGRPVPGCRLRLVDDSGNDVPPGTEGNLLVSGPTRAPLYWGLPEMSAAIMLPDGFLRTGDICVEKDGYFYHRGRSDDMIKAGPRWISPVVVEEALAIHPAVADCAVAAVSVGTLVKPGAFVVLKSGFGETAELAQTLREHVKALLPSYMCPARVRFMADLPRTATGKLQRHRLRRQV